MKMDQVENARAERDKRAGKIRGMVQELSGMLLDTEESQLRNLLTNARACLEEAYTCARKAK